MSLPRWFVFAALALFVQIVACGALYLFLQVTE